MKRPHKNISTLTYLHRRLAVVGLWYAALTIGLLSVLLLTAAYQPAVSSHLLFGAPALSWLTAAEVSHMADVHILIRDAMLIGLTAFILVASYWFRHSLDAGMTRGALWMQIALCALLIPFPWTFTRFHQAFFPQGNWQFASDSWLITTFPAWYFALAAVVWFGVSMLILWTLHRQYTKKH